MTTGGHKIAARQKEAIPSNHDGNLAASFIVVWKTTKTTFMAFELSLKQRPTVITSFPCSSHIEVTVMMMMGKRMYYRAEVTPSLGSGEEPVDFMGDK